MMTVKIKQMSYKNQNLWRNAHREPQVVLNSSSQDVSFQFIKCSRNTQYTVTMKCLSLCSLDDGRKATFRECYFGSISSLYTNFDCEKISRNRQYDVVECHKCKGDLCNSSTRLSHSTYGMVFFTLIVMLISFMLKM